jgi:hypothetical protein
MKLLSSLCLLVAVACQAASYYGMYSLGWLGSAWRYLNFFTLDPVLFLSVVGLVGATIASLVLRSHIAWCVTMLAAFFVSLCVQLYVLPPPVRMVIYGVRNHVLQVSSPDDLRRFARDFHEAIPYQAIAHGSVESLSDNQAAAYRKMQESYPFMKWTLDAGDGPSIFERDSRVNVEWGGSTAGHWGFSITVDGAQNRPNKGPRSEILPVSDDIYFYRAE